MVTSVTETNALASTAPAQSVNNDDVGALTSDFDTFLQLLTAQLENQDPLKPLESTEFVAQLAQFSAVEQQIQTNDQLTSILDALGGGANGAAAWLGQEVLGASTISFEGGETPLTLDPGDDATSAQLTVRDESGAIVSIETVDPQASAITWSGKTSSGEDAPDGIYSFSVLRFRGDERLDPIQPLAFEDVREVRIGSDGLELVLDGGDVISASSVEAVRAPVSRDAV